MKDIIKTYWIAIILIIAPVLRQLTENSTIHALSGLVVWSLLWFIFVTSLFILLSGVVFIFWLDDLKIDKVENAMEIFQKVQWWKMFIHVTPVLGTYVYVEWTGPAILYTIVITMTFSGIMCFKAGLEKKMTKGIKTLDSKEDIPVIVSCDDTNRS